MFTKVSERIMHRLRWLLASGWLLLIFSLFYDPISPWLTQSDNQLSPLRIDPEICVQVQGVCLEEQPYPLGTSIFWGVTVPLVIFTLLVFGHELWRRICPLSFFSQIPRALGWQRQRRRVNAKTGKVRYELAKVEKNSWLARNHLYLQFGLFYLGLCSRILFVNSNRLALGIFLIGTILAAIAVGYFYGGKSWCQYFCPMAPVQKIYGEPRGLLNSKAHEDQSSPITQSMCRIVKPDGKEQSACVACQSPCIDIDAERSYWNGITKPQQRWIYYGYVGIVIGYACYYYLYAGNWDYYFSGAWAHQENQWATILSPGFYLFDRSIEMPKLLAVPLTLGLFTISSYFLLSKLEKLYKAYLFRKKQYINQEQVQHRIFTLCTFFIFNVFFVFGGRPLILLLPLPWQYLYNLAIAFLSTLWLYRTWGRNENLYARESLAHRLRKQLSKLQLDVSRFLEGRSLADLNADEVYVLAKVLPGFTKEKRMQAYKGVFRDSLQQGYFTAADSLEKLQQMRQELEITDEGHQNILSELATEEPKLFYPNRNQNREDWLRLESYSESLETMLDCWWQQRPATGLAAELFDVVAGKKSIESISELFDSFVEDNSEAIQANRREYAITSEEEEEILMVLERNRKPMESDHSQQQQKMNQTDGIDYIKKLQKEAEKLRSYDDW
ncbi:MAG: 4Fe-4S binding protein [Symploca sp. SIO2D2]|nr:4Fe-4S binding protein [Symploca sp. SIO2D2]